MTIQTNFPNIKPTLLLDFANVKALDPRITFTRASEGRYYDGKTVAKAEENLLLQSQAFNDTSAWTFDGAVLSVTANASFAPDGTTTAERVTPLAVSSGFKEFQQNVSLVSGQNYAFSIFLKADGYSLIQIYGSSAAFGTFAINYDVSSGTETNFDAGSSTVVSRSITSVGNGWYRVAVVATCLSSTSGRFAFSPIPATNSARGAVWTPNGTSSFLVWGAQLEQRSSVTAYTATTTQPITNYIPVLLTAASGAGRFDHDPVTGTSSGFLVEEQRTNLLTYSAQFDNAAWVKNEIAITANETVSPDGQQTADRLIATSVNSEHVADNAFTATSGTTYTVSAFVKAAGLTDIGLRFTTGSTWTGSVSPQVRFNLTNQSMVVISGTPASYAISSVGNGWFRVSMSVVCIANGTPSARMQLMSGSNNTFAGDGYSGIYIWGAQLEAGSVATSYIPTVAAQVTRAADAAVMTGTNFSSWYRQDEGTVYCESNTASLANNHGTWAIGNPSLGFASGNMLYEVYASGASGARLSNVISNGTAQVSNIGASVLQSANTFTKGAFGYALNNFASSVSGVSPVTDTSGVIPQGVTGLSIGSLSQGWAGATNYLNGHIRKIAYYPARLTNAQLQALTS